MRNSEAVVSFNRTSMKAARGWCNSLRSDLFEGVGRHRTETTSSLKKAEIDLARSGNIRKRDISVVIALGRHRETLLEETRHRCCTD